VDPRFGYDAVASAYVERFRDNGIRSVETNAPVARVDDLTD
jgi:hypothetical protein